MKTRSYQSVTMSKKTNMPFIFTEHILAILKAENVPLMMHRIGLLSAFMWPKADFDYECDEKDIDKEFAEQIDKIQANTPQGAAKIQFFQFQRSIQIYRALMDLADRIRLIGEEELEEHMEPFEEDEEGEVK